MGPLRMAFMCGGCLQLYCYSSVTVELWFTEQLADPDLMAGATIPVAVQECLSRISDSCLSGAVGSRDARDGVWGQEHLAMPHTPHVAHDRLYCRAPLK